MTHNQIVGRIAQKIRASRMARAMTMEELARRTNVTKGLLSKIENLRTLPSVPVLIDIIHGLGLSMKDFFVDMVLVNGCTYILIKRDQCETMQRDGRVGFNYKRIITQAVTAPGSVEIVLLTIEPGATSRASTTDGFEFKYIISGQCDYFINDDMIHLEEGDSIFFDASQPHLPSNNYGEAVTMLVMYFLVGKN